MRIRGFEWDAGSAGHIEEKHGVTPGEVEEVFRGGPLLRRGRKGRMTALGRTTAGRYLFVVYVWRPGGKVRVITARDMTLAERRYYRRQGGR
ncbi:MAG: BrnT family toxin [Firmicutes bacterium]|nr:BrnT family toxin [Bacillota bacterium]